MNKVIKLITLIILSLSVYFIYQNTKESNIKVLILGDNLSKELKENNKTCSYITPKTFSSDQVSINRYVKQDLSIKELKEKIITQPQLKKELTEAHFLFITIGYNDILYKLSIEENKEIPHFEKIIKKIEKEYTELLKEIKKYYKNDIIVIGYYKTNNEDYYQNIGIKKINKYLENNKEVKYIETYSLISNKENYFLNPNSYYLNCNGYKMIADKIIQETLAKNEKL